MNCSDFENELTALAAGELDDELRGPCLERLLRHAASCEGCGRTRALLNVLALAPAERDLVDDPPAAYWETFDARLAARIAEAEAAPSERSSRRRWLAAAAASVGLLGLLGGSLWFWPGGDPGGQVDLTWLMAENMTRESDAAPVEFPGDLAAMLEDLSVEQAADALEGVGGLEIMPWARQAWVDPDDGYDALLDDVKDPEQLAQLDNWLPTAGAVSLEAEAGLSGVGSGTLTPFPDPQALDEAARKEFLQWLSEQISPASGVS